MKKLTPWKFHVVLQRFVGGRAKKRRATQFGKPRLDLGISEDGVDLLVELVNDLSLRVLGRADALPAARFLARYKLSQGGDVR
jgi:hypothetical protein